MACSTSDAKPRQGIAEAMELRSRLEDLCEQPCCIALAYEQLQDLSCLVSELHCSLDCLHRSQPHSVCCRCQSWTHA